MAISLEKGPNLDISEKWSMLLRDTPIMSVPLPENNGSIIIIGLSTLCFQLLREKTDDWSLSKNAKIPLSCLPGCLND